MKPDFNDYINAPPQDRGKFSEHFRGDHFANLRWPQLRFHLLERLAEHWMTDGNLCVSPQWFVLWQDGARSFIPEDSALLLYAPAADEKTEAA